MTGKSEGAFRTIGEVAESLDLPQHVLRFWETRFSEIEPVKRAGGRRYYRPRDVELVAAIRHLLYGQGYTIRGVQRLLKEQGVRAVIENARGAPRSSAVVDAPIDPDEPNSPPDRATGEAASPQWEEETIVTEEATIVAAEFQDAGGGAVSAPPASFEPGRAALVALPREPATLTLPAVRIFEAPVFGVRGEDAERLREALLELAECRRLLELTRRWSD